MATLSERLRAVLVLDSEACGSIGITGPGGSFPSFFPLGPGDVEDICDALEAVSKTEDAKADVDPTAWLMVSACGTRACTLTASHAENRRIAGDAVTPLYRQHEGDGPWQERAKDAEKRAAEAEERASAAEAERDEWKAKAEKAEARVAELESGGEPVAWLMTNCGAPWATISPSVAESERQTGSTVTPLYRHPPKPEPVVEAEQSETVSYVVQRREKGGAWWNYTTPYGDLGHADHFIKSSLGYWGSDEARILEVVATRSRMAIAGGRPNVFVEGEWTPARRHPAPAEALPSRDDLETVLRGLLSGGAELDLPGGKSVAKTEDVYTIFVRGKVGVSLFFRGFVAEVARILREGK